MSVKMKFGSKDIPFVYKGDKLVYPNPIKDGLLLWYDFKGMRNTDVTKEVAKDLSGNGNDGTLTNFNFTEESGYKDNTLVFDGVDDSLTIPELVLDETAMTVVQDGKLYAYEDDKVMTVGEDGEIVGGGKNLLLKSNRKTVNSDYLLTEYEISEPLEDGDEVVLTFKGNYGADKTAIFLYNSGGSVNMTQVQKLRDYLGNDIFQTSFTWSNSTSDGRYTADSSTIRFYVAPSNGVTESSIEWAKLIKGSVKSIEWHSNPVDYKTTTLSPTSLTDLQLYNKTLRKDELLHNAESKGLKKLKPGVIVQDGLVLHYDFSHESNTSEYKGKAFDYSGNGNHGILQNFNFTEESGYVGDKLKFDGVDDWFETQKIGLAQTSGIKNWTFDFTLDLQSESTRGSILNIPFNPERLSIKSFEDAIAIGRFYNGYWWGRTTPTLNRGKNNIVILCELLSTQETSVPSMNLTVYVNGEIVELLFAPSSGYYSNIVNFLHVGWQGTDASQPQNAYLDEGIHSIKIYPRFLTPEEIAHNYAIEKEKFNIVEGEI